MRRVSSTIPVYLILWLAVSLPAAGQGPVNDRLEVTLPHTTWVGSHSLAPGKYTIRQLPTASNPRLLEFSSNNGTKMEAAITTFAALDNNNTRESSVVLEQRGGQYYLKQVWVGGKTYGYELPVEVRDQVAQRSETFTLTATSNPTAAPSAPPEPVASAAPAPSHPTAPEPTTAQPETSAKAAAPESSTGTAPVDRPASEPAASPQSPAVAPQAQQPTTPAQPEQSSAVSGDSQSGKGQFGAQTPPMPETATFWSEYVLAGILLAFLGFIMFPVGRLRS